MRIRKVLRIRTKTRKKGRKSKLGTEHRGEKISVRNSNIVGKIGTWSKVPFLKLKSRLLEIYSS
jgi:hypothetical protein